MAPYSPLDRRDFMKTSAAAASVALLSGGARAATENGLDHRNERTDRMEYRKLGRTNFMCSKLVFGCGAALAGGKAVRLLERAFEAGVNFYDVGYDDYYKGSEQHLAPFIEAHRGDLWITSKAPARMQGDTVNAETAKNAADYWLGQLDLSLERMKTEHVDAYYLMGVSSPALLKSEELANAFQSAKKAGKVDHWGISTHQNAQECLEACIETGWYSLAMIAITPSGWYDYGARKLRDGTSTMKELRPLLDRARQAGIGLVGMKAGRYIASNPYGGKYGTVTDAAAETAFDHHYASKLLKAELTPFQRSYAYVLENGLDVVNADMQNIKHFEENLYAARTAHTYFA